MEDDDDCTLGDEPLFLLPIALPFPLISSIIVLCWRGK